MREVGRGEEINGAQKLITKKGADLFLVEFSANQSGYIKNKSVTFFAFFVRVREKSSFYLGRGSIFLDTGPYNGRPLFAHGRQPHTVREAVD